ncbi:arsenite methyltransferase [Methanothrix thermoacetophila]|uniref:Arsenite methyltransferase n=1 Tax=Methanothrix thermoacetophila (strain DSM 6194 / JCM 14653 / NBRC 101360 / PT) TaxID=349307 RepID=A0B930_METTP|nr:Methyltransferase type 11 [Methanothrix thermoacetophila PT]
MFDMLGEREIKKAVRDGYSRIAMQATCCSGSCCGTGSAAEISRRIGYTDEEMLSAPPESNLGLGCGNPVAIASLKRGEYVLDMGSGAGFDCFLAARAVGPEGMVIGVDMTSEMVDRARENARKGGYRNVDFRQGELENLPVADNYVDVIMSNCVINLVPDKRRVFREAFRVLKPGGRLIISDIVLKREIPEAVRRSKEAYVGCLAGAVTVEEYIDAMRSAGFEEISILGESPFPVECLPANITKVDLSESVCSMRISARKPA